MSIIVQKYGGSSLANSKLINHVAERTCSTQDRDNRVVAVVSAMGDTTDQLLELARSAFWHAYAGRTRIRRYNVPYSL